MNLSVCRKPRHWVLCLSVEKCGTIPESQFTDGRSFQSRAVRWLGTGTSGAGAWI
jgi:hypothetical protein